MRAWIVMVVANFLACSSPILAATFEISPAPTLPAGDAVDVALRGLPPRERIELRAQRWLPGWPRSSLYRSRAVFISDEHGRVDLARSAPVEGDYSGADRAGLFWSMVPVDGEPAAKNSELVELSAFARGQEVARTSVRFQRKPEDLVEQPVPQFPGATLYRLRDLRNAPVIIVLGGSEGGTFTSRLVGPRLAARGYAVLGLPYYSPRWNGTSELPELPGSFVDIPVDRLDQVHQWLRQQRDLDANRIAVWGVSKGAEFAMLAGSRFPWIRAIVGVVPSDVVWEGWGAEAKAAGTRSSFSWRDRPLPFVPYVGMAEALAPAQRGEIVTTRRPHDEGRAAAAPATISSAEIPVERFAGPMLVAGGGRDQSWDSFGMASRIAARRARAGRATTCLTFPDADHLLVGDQFEPGTTGRGGDARANAVAKGVLWTATLRFLMRRSVNARRSVSLSTKADDAEAMYNAFGRPRGAHTA